VQQSAWERRRAQGCDLVRRAGFRADHGLVEIAGAGEHAGGREASHRHHDEQRDE
jgi:hypothetical protein